MPALTSISDLAFKKLSYSIAKKKGFANSHQSFVKVQQKLKSSLKGFLSILFSYHLLLHYFNKKDMGPRDGTNFIWDA